MYQLRKKPNNKAIIITWDLQEFFLFDFYKRAT